MKYLLLAAFTLSLTACFNKTYEIKEFNSHMFSDDSSFIYSHLKCEGGAMQTDPYNSVDNEVFRCSDKTNTVYFEIESDGNNSEDLKSATVLWKDWYNELDPQESETQAKRYIAVFAKLYAKDHQVKLVESFIKKQNSNFKSKTYDITVKADKKDFYSVKTATVKFL
ncbi:MAG: hypothetical protein CFH44_00683 [Proteobacteria bacterium]|nr:MAG: hypothetical protein CFH44_00683 [Pseudomonadota bacterium]